MSRVQGEGGGDQLNNQISAQIAGYLRDNMDTYLEAVGRHLGISLLVLAAAMAIGIPFGYFAVRFGKYEKIIMSVFQVLRIIPSLAVLILLIPWLGTGLKPAMTALILLAVPPILMNTATGLHQVPAFMLETAQAMGMMERQVLWKVRFPLALPMILTGIKTATIEIIASATLASKIGAGGLGDIIFTGLGLNRVDLLLLGGVSVALLSIFSALLLDLLDRLLFRYNYL